MPSLTLGALSLKRRRIPRPCLDDPRTVATVLKFEPVKGVDAETLAPKVIDNNLVDKLVKGGFINKLYR